MTSVVRSRRSFLKNSFIAAGVSLSGLTFSSAFGLKPARAAEDDIQTILDVAATAEAFACTHYARAISSALFNDVQTSYLKAGLDSEFQHLAFLQANGAKLLAEKFYFPVDTFASTTNFSQVTAIAETVFVAAYLAATNRFAELGQASLATTAAQIAVVEGQHLAVVRIIGGELANNIAYGKTLFGQVSEAVSVVAPLLDGQEGVLGPMEKSSVSFPGSASIRNIIGDSQLDAVEPFVNQNKNT
ncbi:MAG: ferritin-like domain-containing protein [Anaerolineae bacterium]|nr:ferritin-like domain-containing protein [Anaerolineae bacterium]